MKDALTVWLDEVGLDDVARVGGKNASLGELHRAIAPRGVRVPAGFATTAAAYRAFIDEAELAPRIARELDGLDPNDVVQLQAAGSRIRSLILKSPLPAKLDRAIAEAYAKLEERHGAECDVAVRSSATAEDLPEASFAGQLESFLNVRGARAVVEAAHRCFASLYTDRAIAYRAERGFTGGELALSVGVQPMIRSDLAGAGVMFSLDPESGFRDIVLISAAWGLGESVVQGRVRPDEYCVFKPTLGIGFRPILRKRARAKETKLVYDDTGDEATRTVPVEAVDRERFVLADDEILELARWASLVEAHYSARRGCPTPMDMEWAKDGRTGELYLVQARPETVHARRAVSLERFHLDGTGRVLATGRAIGSRIGRGSHRLLRRRRDRQRLRRSSGHARRDHRAR